MKKPRKPLETSKYKTVQERILIYLREYHFATIADLAELFPTLTRDTIQFALFQLKQNNYIVEGWKLV